MSGSTTPGVNAPTTQPLPPGLMNSATGLPSVPDAAGYTPTSATATPATSASYSANPFTVTPNQTVAGQISNIIASGSPLMQQATANANAQMNQRGLLNSSQAITAGQSALYAAATPIATADANTYAQAATNTTTAQNTAASAEAAAKNAAILQNSQLGTQTSQFNAGAINTAAAAQTAAQNTLIGNMQQIAGSTNIANINAASSRAIAQIQADTTLSVTEKNNATSQVLAQIQANTSLTIADQQNASQQIIAQMNNANAQALADKNNSAALANIQRQGEINAQIQVLANNNKTLLQTSASASQFYTQTLTNISNIVTNPNLGTAQMTAAMNDQVTALQDGLAAIQGIANNTAVTSTLQFNAPPPGPGPEGSNNQAVAPGAAPAGSDILDMSGNVFIHNATPDQIAQARTKPFLSVRQN